MSEPEWIAADWPAPPGIVGGTTLRRGGLSHGRYASLNLGANVGDEPGLVAENRARFREACGLPAEPLWLEQVHGTVVVAAEEAIDTPQADGIFTGRDDVVCAVLTADCLPVLFASSDGRAMAAAHAGWRGLCDGVLESTVAALNTNPSDLLVWLGPAISPVAFEVGDEVRERFLMRDQQAADLFGRNKRGRWQADLSGLATRRLQQVGVSHIWGGRHCTLREPEAFFSYRRDGQCGRMATFIFRRRGRQRLK